MRLITSIKKHSVLFYRWMSGDWFFAVKCEYRAFGRPRPFVEYRVYWNRNCPVLIDAADTKEEARGLARDLNWMEIAREKLATTWMCGSKYYVCPVCGNRWSDEDHAKNCCL